MKILDKFLNDLQMWEYPPIITIDLDFCSDQVLIDTLNIVESFQIEVIFFITHKTKLLDKMRQNNNYELGIHPNFNFLLNGSFEKGKNINEIIENLLKFVPEARSVRSHSMTQNSIILDRFYKYGLIFDFNTFIPYSSKIVLHPYKHFNGLIKVPYFWEDDIHLLYKWSWDINKFLDFPGLKVFDFHPIHIFLNTEDIIRYNEAKVYTRNFNSLKKFVNKDKYGIRNFFIDLLKLLK